MLLRDNRLSLNTTTEVYVLCAFTRQLFEFEHYNRGLLCAFTRQSFEFEHYNRDLLCAFMRQSFEFESDSVQPWSSYTSSSLQRSGTNSNNSQT